MSDIDPAALTNDARTSASKLALDMHKAIKDEIVTRPIVSNPVSPDEKRYAYLKVRNNEQEIGALVQHRKLRQAIRDLKDGERRFQHDMKNGRYDE